MHRITAFDNEAHAVVEAERAVGGECGVFTEAVARAHTRLKAESFNRIEHHEARHERGELGVASVFQRVGIGVEQEGADVATADGRRLLDQFPTFVVAPGSPHAGSLRP